MSNTDRPPGNNPSSKFDRSSDDLSASILGARAEAVSTETYLAALDSLAIQYSAEAGLTVVVHLPFCTSRCSACDRVAHISHDTAEMDRYLDNLDKEMSLVSRRLGHGFRVGQLHFSGGTPNYLSNSQLARVRATVDQHFVLDEATYISMDCSPSRSSLTQFELLAGLGVNSVRFEIREFQAGTGSGLGRAYSPELMQDAVANARAAGIEDIVLDLAYGFPGQQQSDIDLVLANVADLEPDRIFCHPFSLREQEFPHQKILGREGGSSLATKMMMFSTLSEGFQSLGYVWVGINGFVKPDDRLDIAQREQRLHAMRSGYSDIATTGALGFGLGAVSEFPGALFQNLAVLAAWTGRIESGQSPVWCGVFLTDQEKAEREAISRLSANLVASETSLLSETSSGRMNRLEQQGLIARAEGQLSVTIEGRVVLNEFWGDASALHRITKVID